MFDEKAEIDSDEPVLDYSTLSEEEQHERMIWWWFDFFRQNEHFEQYCEAKRTNNAAICAGLEQQFNRIADLYADWGDIHVLPSMHDVDSLEWKNWLTEKKPMFFPCVRLVRCGDAIASESLLISVPLGLSAPELVKSFKKLLNEHPEILGTGAKYALRRIQNETLATTLRRLDNANLVADLLSGPGDFGYSTTEIAQLILKVPDLQDDFGWYPTKSQKDLIERGVSLLSDLAVLTHKSRIMDLNQFYFNCIEDTIHGVFPSKTKR